MTIEIVKLKPYDLFMHFNEKFKETMGFPYLANLGKDLALFKLIAAVHGEKTFEIIDLFFDDPEDFSRDRGMTVGIFYTQVNRLMAKLSDKGSGGSLYGQLRNKINHI